jgi:hypothetical protein
MARKWAVRAKKQHAGREDDKTGHFLLLSVIVRNVFVLLCVVIGHLHVDEIQNFQA